MTTDANRAQLWARVLVQELAACGVREVCLAPGSRSSALALAAEADDRLRVRVFVDERCAGFFALGLGKATGTPAAVITTSGTAVANLLPAVVEASQAEVPLLLLTADRPPRLRDADANQAIRQPGIFGDCTREAWDLPLPRVQPEDLRHLRSVACRALAAAVGLPAGPVHLNLPFDKPLEPTLVEGDVPPEFAATELARGRPDNAPWIRVHRRVPALDEAALSELATRISAAARPVLVAGPHPDPGSLGPAATKFAGQGGVPLLADPLSGARFGPSHGAVRSSHHDLFLRDAEVGDALAPDLVIRVGQGPTSAPTQRWLERIAGPQILIDPSGRWKDHAGIATEVVRGDAVKVLSALQDHLQRPAAADWRRRWVRVDDAVVQAIAEAPGPRHEGAIARVLLERLPAQTPLFVSSSMPIRDVDAFGRVREDELFVLGNRGASGIDGIVSTALGTAAGTGRRTVALIGDLALLHDQGGLLATREPDVDCLIIVVNNDGGGIFHMLPIREYDPPFEKLFATPHGIEPARIAEVYGLPHARVDLEGDFEGAIRRELGSPGTRILEIRTRRDTNRIGHEATTRAAVEAARTALNAPEE